MGRTEMGPKEDSTGTWTVDSGQEDKSEPGQAKLGVCGLVHSI